MVNQEASNVAELVAILSKLPDDATVFTLHPPFTGVKVIEQNDGSVGIFPIRVSGDDTEDCEVTTT